MNSLARTTRPVAGRVSRQQRDRLIVKYRDYVRSVALRMIGAMNLPSQDLDEYISAGYIGLIEAAQRFNPDVGTGFEGYAYLRIRGAIIDNIRAHSELSGKAYRFVRAMQAVQDLREGEADSALAEDCATGSRGGSINRMLDFAANGALAFRLSLSEGYEGITEECSGEENPERRLLVAERNRKFREMVATLPRKERTIIEDFYFKEKSFKEIADEKEGHSKSWVSRLHSRALERLKEMYLESKGEETD